jgi:HTH-type transcriptional regulator/antitoxin HipB
MQHRFLTTPEAVGQAVREGRKAAGWTQAELATRAGVGRRFVVDLEAGHERAELGKVLAVLEALDIHATALPPPPPPATRPQDVDLKAVIARFA